MTKLKGKAKFAPKENSPFGPEAAELVAQVANEISAREPLTRAAFVEYSKAPRSATHKLFEWNLKKAAEAHWLERAGELIGCVYEINTTTGKPVRSYHSVVSVTSDGDAMRSYMPVRKVLLSDSMMGQVSNDTYARILAECERIEAMGLDKDPAWRRIVSAVRTNVPLSAG